MKLDVRASALTCTWSGESDCSCWHRDALHDLPDAATTEPTFIGSIYRGYTVTPMASVIGLLWAVPDAFIDGAIFCWLYDLLASPKST